MSKGKGKGTDGSNVVTLKAVKSKGKPAELTANDVLSSALEAGYKDVIVVGRLPSGVMRIAPSYDDANRVCIELSLAAAEIFDIADEQNSSG